MKSIAQFKGMFPRITSEMRPHNVASRALDCDLRDGNIRAWRKPKVVAQAVTNAVSFYNWGCHYLSWGTCVKAVPTPVNYGMLLLIGRSNYPEYLKIKGDTQIYTRLGIPRPTQAPVVSNNIMIEENDAIYATSYVYTFENDDGHEGAPSPASNTIIVNEENGYNVAVSNIESYVSPEYRVTKVNLYRSIPPLLTGDEADAFGNETTFLLVGSFPIGTTEVDDEVGGENLGTALFTLEFREPPSNLTHLVAVSNSNTYVGAVGNKIFFSQNNRFWNWPAEFDLTIDYNVVHMEEINGSIFISTTGRPYLIPNVATCQTRVAQQIFPMDTYSLVSDVGCSDIYGSCATPFGMVYASTEGVLVVTDKHEIQNVTLPYYLPEQWRTLRPDSFRFSYWEGLLFAISESISFIVQLDNKYHYGRDDAGIVEISHKPIAMHTNNLNNLFILDNDMIYQWAAGDTFTPYYWENDSIGLDANLSYSVMRVGSRDCEITIKAPTKGPLVRPIYNNKAQRLPRIGKHKEYSISLTGGDSIEYVLLGNSIREVTRGVDQ